MYSLPSLLIAKAHGERVAGLVARRAIVGISIPAALLIVAAGYVVAPEYLVYWIASVTLMWVVSQPTYGEPRAWATATDGGKYEEDDLTVAMRDGFSSGIQRHVTMSLTRLVAAGGVMLLAGGSEAAVCFGLVALLRLLDVVTHRRTVYLVYLIKRGEFRSLNDAYIS